MSKHLAPALVWLLPLLFFATPAELLMLASATLLHEGGHLFAFAALGHPLPHPRAVLLGLTLTPRTPLSYRHEAIVAAAGPLANLALALPLLTLLDGEGTAALGTVHLFCALSNLLPLGGSDGGRICTAILHLLFPVRTAGAVSAALGRLTLVFLLFFLLYLLLRPGGGSVLLLLICLLGRASPYLGTPP